MTLGLAVGGTASQGSPGKSGSPQLGQSTWRGLNRSQRPSPSSAARYGCPDCSLHRGPIEGAPFAPRHIYLFTFSMFVLQDCWLQRWIVGMIIRKGVWLVAVKFLSVTSSVHRVSCVRDERVLRGTVSPAPHPQHSGACLLLFAVLPLHPDHLLGGALGSHPGLHLPGKCTYRALCTLAPATSEVLVAIMAILSPPQWVSQSQQPLL